MGKRLHPEPVDGGEEPSLAAGWVVVLDVVRGRIYLPNRRLGLSPGLWARISDEVPDFVEPMADTVCTRTWWLAGAVRL